MALTFPLRLEKSLNISSALMLEWPDIHIIPQNAILSHAFIQGHKIFRVPLPSYTYCDLVTLFWFGFFFFFL